jgi:hypothetical protein
MPGRSSKPKSTKRANTRDQELVARRVAEDFRAIADPKSALPPKVKKAAAVALKRLQGAPGGLARAAKLSERRTKST